MPLTGPAESVTVTLNVASGGGDRKGRTTNPTTKTISNAAATRAGAGGMPRSESASEKERSGRPDSSDQARKDSHFSERESTKSSSMRIRNNSTNWRI